MYSIVPPSPELTVQSTTKSTMSSSYDNYDYEPYGKIYKQRPALPVPMDEAGDQLLDKLEQAGRVPSKEKFRRMACNTFVYTGACPYNDRCVFLHDYRIKAEGVKVRATRQAKSNSTIKDTYYWPDMTKKEVAKNMDTQGLPTANQIYVIPEPFKLNPNNFHNRGLYSMWSHFIEFCLHNAQLIAKKNVDVSEDSFFTFSSYRENAHVPGAQRLEVFLRLSLGQSLSGQPQKPSLQAPKISAKPPEKPKERTFKEWTPERRNTWNEKSFADNFYKHSSHDTENILRSNTLDFHEIPQNKLSFENNSKTGINLKDVSQTKGFIFDKDIEPKILSNNSSLSLPSYMNISMIEDQDEKNLKKLGLLESSTFDLFDAFETKPQSFAKSSYDFEDELYDTSFDSNARQSFGSNNKPGKSEFPLEKSLPLASDSLSTIPWNEPPDHSFFPGHEIQLHSESQESIDFPREDTSSLSIYHPESLSYDPIDASTGYQNNSYDFTDSQLQETELHEEYPLDNSYSNDGYEDSYGSYYPTLNNNNNQHNFANDFSHQNLSQSSHHQNYHKEMKSYGVEFEDLYSSELPYDYPPSSTIRYNNSNNHFTHNNTTSNTSNTNNTSNTSNISNISKSHNLQASSASYYPSTSSFTHRKYY